MFSYLFSDTADLRPLVAVSACLVGERVRYDGGHKRHAAIAEQLAPLLDLVAVCPEAEAGLGVPRPPVALRERDGALHALGRDNAALDVSPALRAYAQRQVAHWRELPLAGHIFKSRSPSCGAGSTPVFNAQGDVMALDHGLYAAAVKASLPWLAIVEETALVDAQQLSRFVAHCRLVHELLYRDDVNLLRAWQHYRPLTQEAARERLDTFAADNQRHAFVAQLLNALPGS